MATAGLAAEFSPRVVNTVAELVALTPSQAKPLVEVLGYHHANGGGGGKYIITNSVVGTNAYGGMFASTLSGWSWKLVPENGSVSSKQFGAVVNDGSDCQPALQQLVSYASYHGLEARISSGNHMMLTNVLMTNNTKIVGEAGAILDRGFTSLGAEYALLAVGGSLTRYLHTNDYLTIVATNITIKGVSFVTTDTNYTGAPIGVMDCEGVLVEDNDIGVTSVAWAITVRANNAQIINNRIRTSSGPYATVFTDGIHVLGGTNGIIANNIIETGDDNIAFGPWDQEACVNWTVTGNSGISWRGHAIRFTPDNPNWTNKLKNIVFSSSSSVAGLLSNGGIYLNGAAATNNTYPFENITIQGYSLRMGGITSQGGTPQGNSFGVDITGVNGLTLDNVTVTETPYCNFRIRQSDNVRMINCYGDGGSNPGLNQTVRFETTPNVSIIGGVYKSFTNNVSVIQISGATNAIVMGVTVTNTSTTLPAIIFGSSQTSFPIVIGNSIESPFRGIQFFPDPVLAVIQGNNFQTPTPIAWTTAEPTGSKVYHNIGIGEATTQSMTAYDVTTSGGLYIGTLDQVASSYMRITSTNQLTVFYEENFTGGTKSPGIAFQSSPNSTPNAGMKVTDNASTIVAAIAGGTSLAKAATQVDLYASSSYGVTTGTKMLTVTTNGFRIANGVPSGTDFATILRVESTTQGVSFTPMTKAQRNAIASPTDGLHVYQNDAGNYGPRWYSTTLGGWMKADGTADP